jgi:hypothetical protein
MHPMSLYLFTFAKGDYLSLRNQTYKIMSGPPGSGILNRSPYNGLPSVGGAPPRGIDGGLPSGTVTAGLRNDVIEPMANATATHPFFIAPMQQPNEILENDILMARTSGDNNDGTPYSNLGKDYGIYARPLRLLKQTNDSWFQDGNTRVYGDIADAIAEAKRWRCLGIVVALGAGHDQDRQLVNIAIRGRIGVPNIFRSSTIVARGNNNTITNVTRGDLLAVVIRVKRADGGFVLDADTIALQSASDLPILEDSGLEYYHVLGTYIRAIAKTNATSTTIRSYMNNNAILDRKASYEIALRL